MLSVNKMDIKYIFHALAIIAGILATFFGASSSNNKIVLLVVCLVIAGVFELAIPFLNRSPIDSNLEPLTILFDETRHCFKESNNQCEVYRIGVHNQGEKTVKNVTVKIKSITASQEKQNDELRKFVGLKLCLSVNPFGEYSHPDNLPESSVILHPDDEATFDFMRLGIIPGNYRIFHSNFFLNPQTSRLDQRPRGVLSPGKYTVAISVQGDDLNPIEQRFEVSSSSKSVTFRPVEDVF